MNSNDFKNDKDEFSNKDVDVNNGSKGTKSVENSKKFYEETWVLIFSIIVYPVRIVLMWKYDKFTKPIRIGISVSAAIVTIAALQDRGYSSDEYSTMDDPVSDEAATSNSNEVEEVEEIVDLSEFSISKKYDFVNTGETVELPELTALDIEGNDISSEVEIDKGILKMMVLIQRVIMT